MVAVRLDLPALQDVLLATSEMQVQSSDEQNKIGARRDRDDVELEQTHTKAMHRM